MAKKKNSLCYERGIKGYFLNNKKNYLNEVAHIFLRNKDAFEATM